MSVCCVENEDSENDASGDDDDEYATASSGGEGEEGVSSHASDTNSGPGNHVILVTTKKGIDSCHHMHTQYRKLQSLKVYITLQEYMPEVNSYSCLCVAVHSLMVQVTMAAMASLSCIREQPCMVLVTSVLSWTVLSQVNCVNGIISIMCRVGHILMCTPF